MALTLHGISASNGIAIGKLHVLRRGMLDVPERHLSGAQVGGEIARFKAALRAASRELKAIKARIPSDTKAEIAAFIDTHLLMLEDTALTTGTLQAIRELRCNAEHALKLQRDAIVSVFDAMDDAYLRTRRDDIDHVVNRVQRILSGGRTPVFVSRPDDPQVVFADDLAPSDTMLMQDQGVAAFLTEYGGPLSHTAILARSLGVPAVVGLHGARAHLRDDELVIVDGRQGVVVVAPDPATLRHYRSRRKEIMRVRAARGALRKTPAVTGDGEPVTLQANVEFQSELALAIRDGAAGVGLYRTEYLFLNRSAPPTEAEQHEAYAGIVRAAKGGPVTIRTLDLGADKQIDGARPGAPVSQNPALGLRAVRLCLREPGLFKPQLRAILRASAHGPVRMLIPMISSTGEFEQVLDVVRICKQELSEEGVPFDPATPLGGMIEVPAAAVCADLFARDMDFLSIGTNDLIQYTIAVDRVDDEVSYLYDPLHPAVLRLISTIIKAGRRAGIPVALCGEMAGDARYTRLLLGMGLKEFSVHPNALLEIKQAILEAHAAKSRILAKRILGTAKRTRREALLNELNH